MKPLTSFECAVLAAIQQPLPLCERPFAKLAETVGCDEPPLLAAIERLRADGFIRRYRAQLRYRSLGRVAVLAAGCVPTAQFDAVAAQVSALAGVSHNYQREGRLNLWFTLQGETMEAVEAMLGRLRHETGVAFYSFPAERVYKLDVRFDPAGPGAGWFEPVPEPVSPPPVDPSPLTLTPDEKAVLKAIQRELPIEPRPFATLPTETPVAVLQSLAEKGVLGKIAAVLDYPRLGYSANAMACATVEDGRINAVGAALAQIPAVSHCYRRRAYPDWPYTLYAMLHADTLGRIEAFMQTFCRSHSIAEYTLLTTVRELKKKPVAIDL